MSSVGARSPSWWRCSPVERRSGQERPSDGQRTTKTNDNNRGLAMKVSIPRTARPKLSAPLLAGILIAGASLPALAQDALVTGGTLVVARAADVVLWDPKFTNDNDSLWAQGQIYANLLQNSPD